VRRRVLDAPYGLRSGAKKPWRQKRGILIEFDLAENDSRIKEGLRAWMLIAVRPRDG
jgi:hypothetical protein